MVKYAKRKKYGIITLDPVHIGAGGYKLGGVDNTIVREPTTDIPKIPGTSLSGVLREYLTINFMEKDQDCIQKRSIEEKRKCAEKKVISFFGDEDRQGLLRVYDSQILFFPVSTVQGIVWITTKELLTYWFKGVGKSNKLIFDLPEKIKEDMIYLLKGIEKEIPLNLGWLMLNTSKSKGGKKIRIPLKISKFMSKIVIVSEKLFSRVINDNLEVRTSVRIDPETGSAEDGGLFTYEAIPRGSILIFEVVIDNRRGKRINYISKIEEVFPYLRLLGVGGMVTRGFGRIDVFKLNSKN